MREILKLGLILTAYVVTAGAALALVNIRTAPIIEESRKAALDAARARVLSDIGGERVLPENGSGWVLPDMVSSYEFVDADTNFPYWIGYRDAAKSEIGGYIFIAYGIGYSSTIETMVGVGSDGKIVGVMVLFQQETPGLGDKIEEVRRGEDTPWFTQQYIGATRVDNMAVTEDGGAIDSITGATITSQAVTDSIRWGLEQLHEKTGVGE